MSTSLFCFQFIMDCLDILAHKWLAVYHAFCLQWWGWLKIKRQKIHNCFHWLGVVMFVCWLYRSLLEDTAWRYYSVHNLCIIVNSLLHSGIQCTQPLYHSKQSYTLEYSVHNLSLLPLYHSKQSYTLEYSVHNLCTIVNSLTLWNTVYTTSVP